MPRKAAAKKTASLPLPEPLQLAPVPEKTSEGCSAPGKGFCFDLGDAASKTLVPQIPRGPAVNDTAQFFANNLKNVCRVKKVAAKCFVSGTEESEKPKKIKAWGKDTPFPKPKNENEKKQACDAAKGAFMPAYEEGLRRGKLELDFLSEAQAQAISQKGSPAKAGPNLRLCFADKQKGVMIPVRTPQDAVVVRDTYKECIASSNDAQSCAVTVARKGARKTRVVEDARRRSVEQTYGVESSVGPEQEPALFGAPKKRRARGGKR